MAMIRWNPWKLSLDDDFDMPTLPGLSRLGQGLNLYETKDSIVAEAALPGIPEDNIDVTIDDGIVRVTATIQHKEEEKEDTRFFMRSMASAYNYSFRLPEGIVADAEPKCELEDGVLTLTFSKVEPVPPKKISVTKKAKQK